MGIRFWQLQATVLYLIVATSFAREELRTCEDDGYVECFNIETTKYSSNGDIWVRGNSVYSKQSPPYQKVSERQEHSSHYDYGAHTEARDYSNRANNREVTRRADDRQERRETIRQLDNHEEQQEIAMRLSFFSHCYYFAAIC